MHPLPPSSTQLQQPLPSFLQDPQQYLNQNITHNWAISPNFGQKIKSCSFWLKICTHGILGVLIPNLDLNFWNSDPKIHFWANLGQKLQSCPICLKIGTHGISKMLILIPILVFWISNPNFLFGQIWAKKVKVVCFNWKLTHMSSWICRFRIWYRFLKFRPQNSFLGKFGSKKSKLVVFPKNSHSRHFDDADSYSNISFLNFQPWIHFWQNLGQKSQSYPVWLKIGTQSVSSMSILIPALLFWASILK